MEFDNKIFFLMLNVVCILLRNFTINQRSLNEHKTVEKMKLFRNANLNLLNCEAYGKALKRTSSLLKISVSYNVSFLFKILKNFEKNFEIILQ